MRFILAITFILVLSTNLLADMQQIEKAISKIELDEFGSKGSVHYLINNSNLVGESQGRRLAESLKSSNDSVRARVMIILNSNPSNYGYLASDVKSAYKVERNQNVAIRMIRFFSSIRFIDDEILELAKHVLMGDSEHHQLEASIYFAMSENGTPEFKFAKERITKLLISGSDNYIISMINRLNEVGVKFEFIDDIMQKHAISSKRKSIKEASANYLAKNTYLAREKKPISNETIIAVAKPKTQKPSVALINMARAQSIDEYSVAVVIGNQDYAQYGKSVPDVSFAKNDASAIKEYLVRARGFKEGNILYMENASQADMISAFGNDKTHKGQLFNWIRPEESEVFVFYSGHGAPSLRDGSGYLLPVDANPSTVELNGYSLDTLYDNLSKMNAKNITVIIDACFSGSSQSGTIISNASSITLKPITIPTVSDTVKMNVLSATDVGEIASWDVGAEHGLFTSYFLKGISGEADRAKTGNGNNKVELEELKKYLAHEVSYMARRQYGREQHPQVSGNGSFVLSEID